MKCIKRLRWTLTAFIKLRSVKEWITLAADIQFNSRYNLCDICVGWNGNNAFAEKSTKVLIKCLSQGTALSQLRLGRKMLAD